MGTTKSINATFLIMKMKRWFIHLITWWPFDHPSSIRTRDHRWLLYAILMMWVRYYIWSWFETGISFCWFIIYDCIMMISEMIDWSVYWSESQTEWMGKYQSVNLCVISSVFWGAISKIKSIYIIPINLISPILGVKMLTRPGSAAKNSEHFWVKSLFLLMV